MNNQKDDILQTVILLNVTSHHFSISLKVKRQNGIWENDLQQNNIYYVIAELGIGYWVTKLI